MSYSYPHNVPEIIKNIPTAAQKLFVSAYNAALAKSDDDSKSIDDGWRSVKTKYKEVDGEWVKKKLSVQLDERVALEEVPDCLPDDVLELPGQLPTAWAMIFNKLLDKNISLPIARDKSWSIVKKYVYKVEDGWKFKQLSPVEEILAKNFKNDSTLRKDQMKVTFFKSNGKETDGDFKVVMGAQFIEKSVGGEKKHFLKGVASGNWLDREDDIVMPPFIQKMREVAKGLPVFTDHVRTDENMIGSVVELESDDADVFDPITELEPPNENQIVKRLQKRMAKGISYGYSIGGKITKAVKVWDETLQKFVRQIIDGDIYEVSVVPVPALEGTDVTMFKKTFSPDSFFASTEVDQDYIDLAKSAGINVDNLDEVVNAVVEDEITDEQVFWLDFEKAVDKFEKLSESQPKDVDINSLPRSCFAKATGDNREEWKYPYMYKCDTGLNKVHYGLLDKAFNDASMEDDERVFNFLKKVRGKLGLSEVDYNFVDFRKVLTSTITEAVEAREARVKLNDILWEFQTNVEFVALNDWQDTDEKIADIKGLTAQLVDAIQTLSEVISRQVVVTLKSLSLENME